MHAPGRGVRALEGGAKGRRRVGVMLKGAFIGLLWAGVLLATSVSAVAVTLPWTEDEAPRAGHLALSVEVRAASQIISAASAASFEGLRAARPNAGQTLLAALVRAAVRHAPWLADAQAQGLWTWHRNPALGVAIYGPGIGGYNSFSWSRDRSTSPDAAASARSRLIVQAAAMHQNAQMTAGTDRGGDGNPSPVPLPPGAALLGAAIGLTLLSRRGRHRC